MVSSINRSTLAVPIDELVEEGELPESDLESLLRFDSVQGNGDGAIDPLEYRVLKEGDDRPSAIARVGLKVELLERGARLFGREPLSFKASGSEVIFTFEDGEKSIVRFDSLGQVETINWKKEHGSVTSLHYYLNGEVTTVVLENGAERLANEDFSSEIDHPVDLPVRPEEFLLETDGWLRWVGQEDRHAGLFELSNPGDELANLKEACRLSHPQFVSRFLHSLLTPRTNETEKDEENAIAIAEQIWQSLLLDPQDSSRKRAVQILTELPLAYQGLLLARSFLQDRPGFDSFLRKIPDPVYRKNLNHLLSSLKINFLGRFGRTKDPEPVVSLPESLKQELSPWLPVSREGEDEFDAEANEGQRDGLRDYVSAVERGRDEKEIGLAMRLQEEGFGDGSKSSIEVECGETAMDAMLRLVVRGDDTGEALLRAVNPPPATAGEKRDTLLFYQKALKRLGVITGEAGSAPIWAGKYFDKNEPQRWLQALRSTLQFTENGEGGTLTGSWEGWFFEDLENLPFFRTTEKDFWSTLERGEWVQGHLESDQEAFRQGTDYGTLSLQFGGSGFLMAGKPSSKFLNGLLPLSDGVTRLYGCAEGEACLSVEIAADPEGHITIEAPIGKYFRLEGGKEEPCVVHASFEMQPLDAEGLCFLSSRPQLRGPMEIYWPDGKITWLSPEEFRELAMAGSRQRELLMGHEATAHGCFRKPDDPSDNRSDE